MIVLSETVHGTSLSGGRILGFCLIRVLLYTLRVSLGGSLALGMRHTSRFHK